VGVMIHPDLLLADAPEDDPDLEPPLVHSKGG
jgi:hypothetical protein